MAVVEEVLVVLELQHLQVLLVTVVLVFKLILMEITTIGLEVVEEETGILHFVQVMVDLVEEAVEVIQVMLELLLHQQQ